MQTVKKPVMAVNFRLALTMLIFSAGVCAGQAASGKVMLLPQVRIVIDQNEAMPVHRAVEDLQRDIRKILGVTPSVVNSLQQVPVGSSAIIIVGPTWSGSGVPVTGDMTGIEAHAVYAAIAEDNTPHIILHGSDMRGTIYAIYTFSEKCLGIPPLWLWASYTPQSKTHIEVPGDFEVRFGQPQVRWRAWFPNDQRQLTLWRARNQDNSDAYAETMLRLKLNMLDVGAFLHSSFNSQYRLATEVEMARRFGIALTATHTAPLGAHPSEERWNNFWTRIKNVNPPPPRSIYDKQSLIEFWTYHIDAVLHHNLEVVWPIAFRGGGDVGFWQGDNFEDPGTDELRAQVIREMLDEQIHLLKTRSGQQNPPMRVTLYNEKSDFVAAGFLELPKEPGLIYNFVAARRDHYPPPDLLGFDFEADQLAGYYFNYQFTSTGSHVVQAEGPRKMEQNFRTVHGKSRTGVELAVVNAGNVREHVMELAAHAAMMWDFGAYDSAQFLNDFSTQYFGQEHAAKIARFTADYYAAYWQQTPSVLEGFERQFIFQDLRLHRAMQTLTNEVKKTTPNLNPFLTGDWFRIDPAVHGVDSEVEAVVVGLRGSISRLIPLTQQADEIHQSLPPSVRTFFNDNFRVQAYFLRHASETVYYLAEAVVAQSKKLPARRARSIRLAAQAAQKMEDILGEAEHGLFEGWYNPLRFEEITSIFNLRQRRNAIIELLGGLEATVLSEGFEQGSRVGWYKTPDHANFTVHVADDGAKLGTGKALFVTVIDSATRNLVVNFDTVSLVNAAEMIRLEFDVRLNGTFGSGTAFRNAFRFGLYDSMGTVVDADNVQTAATDDDVGYFLRLACGDSLPLITLLSDAGQATVNGGLDTQTLTTLSAGRLNNHQNHRLAFVITRGEGNQMCWDVYLDGVPVIDGFTHAPVTPYYTFNEIVFTSTAGLDFVLDNVAVSTNGEVAGETDLFLDECLFRFAADYNQDCRVDLDDAVLLGGGWLNAYHLMDLLQLAEDWLLCANLNIANCY